MISNAGFEISKGEEGTPGSTRAWPPALGNMPGIAQEGSGTQRYSRI